MDANNTDPVLVKEVWSYFHGMYNVPIGNYQPRLKELTVETKVCRSMTAFHQLQEKRRESHYCMTFLLGQYTHRIMHNGNTYTTLSRTRGCI